MKKGGITDRIDFEKQSKTLGEMKVRIPEFNEQIKVAQRGLSLLDAVLKGVEQAGYVAQRQQQMRQMKNPEGKEIVTDITPGNGIGKIESHYCFK